MRPHERNAPRRIAGMRAAALHATAALAAACALAGCSRLTFIKPSTERAGFTQVAPDYDVREDPREAKRTLARERASAAAEALRGGDLAQAAQLAQKALDGDRSLAAAHTILAIVAERQGRADEAGEHYAAAAKLAPEQGTTLNNYGAWLCGAGKPADALPYFDRALADRSYPTPAAALANAGTCALRAGQAARAERDLRNALALDPVEATALAGMARLEYGAGDYLQARAFSERRLAAAAATPEVLQLASQIEQKLGDAAASARYVQRMGDEFPQSQQAPRGGESQQ
jgi:type IV pilus assembly protein PilF